MISPFVYPLLSGCVRGPGPLVYVVDQRPAVSVGMDFLLRHSKPISHPVEMVDVDQPHPGNVPLLGHSRSAVPLGLLPQLIGGLQIAAGKGLIHVAVHGSVTVGGVLCGAVPSTVW